MSNIHSQKTPAREFYPGMGQAVADRTVTRKKADGTRESWTEVAHRVALGNTLLNPEDQETEYHALNHHLRQASILMSGRHLQHGDETQPTRNMEVFTNCATSALRAGTFYLLLNGSGVGEDFSDDMMLVDWTKMPTVVPVIDWGHKDRDSGRITGFLTRAEAEHLYKHAKITTYVVPDSREGWALAVAKMEIMAFNQKSDEVLILDFTNVREFGAPIRGMQNRPASGPGPLMQAIRNITAIKSSQMERWRQNMYVSHYLAECVLVGGARRAARMATKNWKDESVLGFIEVKRGGHLWSANNSVTVDDEFWRYVKMGPEEFAKLSWSEQALCSFAKLVLDKIARCSYFDGTGEPGIINQHKLTEKREGLEDYLDGRIITGGKLELPEEYLELTQALAKVVVNKKSVMITNPCGEIPLTMLGGYCVEGSTRILHRDGYDRIETLVGKEVEVFNGERWSKATPFQTGVDQKLLRVKFSDGSYLDCTPYHKFSVKRSRQAKHFMEVEAKDLWVGAILPTFRTPQDITGTRLEDAYTYGVFLGDGGIEHRKDSGKNRYIITLYEGKHHLPVSGTRGSIQANTGIDVTVSHLDLDKLDTLKMPFLPDWLFNMDHESTLEFIRGWLDTDGVYHKDTGGISISMCHSDRAKGLQLLLRRIGVSFASSRLSGAKNQVTNYGKRNHALYQVYVPESEAAIINGHRIKTDRHLCLERLVKQPRVVAIEELPGLHNTYCFTEPERHMGVFNNVLTHQCVISDVVPYHAQSLEDAIDAFRTATRALIRVNTMDCLYRREVDRTNRIGVGMTGLHEFAWKFFRIGFRDMVKPDFEGYQSLVASDSPFIEIMDYEPGVRAAYFWHFLSACKLAVDQEAESYSRYLGVTAPHTNTTMKPAGTTSKLFALSEGAHLPAMAEYLRWVQFRNDDPLVQDYKAKGYPTKELKSYSGTTVVGFPTETEICRLGMGDKLVTAAEATPEEQYEYLRLLEEFWITGVYSDEESGNQVSYTLKYDPQVVDFETFKRTLIEGQSTIRCCSVMPQVDGTAYEYQPEEPISREEYARLVRQIEAAEKEDVDFAHIDCGSGACPIDFNK